MSIQKHLILTILAELGYELTVLWRKKVTRKVADSKHIKQ